MDELVDQVIQDGHTRGPLSPGKSNKTSAILPFHLPSAPAGSRRGHFAHSFAKSSSNAYDEYPRVSSSRGQDRGGANIGRAIGSRERDGGANTESGGAETLNGSGIGEGSKMGITDFFGSEVFQMVLHNPTTAHRFLRFCQSRACGENMEFLQKVNTYHRLLDEVTQSLSSIQSMYASTDAPRQINLPENLRMRISSDIRQTTRYTLPGLESIVYSAQDHVQSLLASDVYPRFVKHQVTASAAMALADHRERFQGLGDCFCLTDPKIADNPIVYASDGFISVTGYTRHDIIPRNCRFLQGERTDPLSRKRLRTAIDNCEETVELLLNYRKNGDPFWNLLYVAPLLNERGEVSFFLGGQINCSTTINSSNDVLRVLSINDDELDQLDEIARTRPSSLKSRASARDGTTKTKSSFFKSFRKHTKMASDLGSKVSVRDEAGMEGELLNRVGKLNFQTQVEAFYTAYSKYLIMNYNPPTQAVLVQHYSPSVIDMLGLNLPNGRTAPIFNKDVFKVLSDYSSASSSTGRAFKNKVLEALRGARAVSLEMGLLTGYEERSTGGFRLGDGVGLRKVEERYVCHWTPLKDQEGRVKWVVLMIAPKM